MNHLEQLISEWYEFKGYFVRRNIKVGKRIKGGWEGELDVVAFNPIEKHLIHIEPSIDGDPWSKREIRFKRKFTAGKKYIKSEIFKAFKTLPEPEQWAVLSASDEKHKSIGGGKVIPIKILYQMIINDIKKYGTPERSAIPEQFSLLRTIQYALNCGAIKTIE